MRPESQPGKASGQIRSTNLNVRNKAEFGKGEIQHGDKERRTPSPRLLSRLVFGIVDLDRKEPMNARADILFRAAQTAHTVKHGDFLRTRHSLLKRLRNWGDQASWQDFFDIYWKFIYGLARKAGLNDAEAQEVVQETVISVAKKIKDFQTDAQRGSFKAWLTHTTRWRIADQFAKRSPGAESPPSPSGTSTSTATVERVPDPASLELEKSWDNEWKQNLLETALAKAKATVDADTYQMFYLHIIRQWPATKVAATVGVKLKRVYYAKSKVSRLLQREISRLRKELI
jgi:RNA polymerase sigma factor (sigma-70 family)